MATLEERLALIRPARLAGQPLLTNADFAPFGLTPFVDDEVRRPSKLVRSSRAQVQPERKRELPRGGERGARAGRVEGSDEPQIADRAVQIAEPADLDGGSSEPYRRSPPLAGAILRRAGYTVFLGGIRARRRLVSAGDPHDTDASRLPTSKKETREASNGTPAARTMIDNEDEPDPEHEADVGACAVDAVGERALTCAGERDEQAAPSTALSAAPSCPMTGQDSPVSEDNISADAGRRVPAAASVESVDEDSEWDLKQERLRRHVVYVVTPETETIREVLSPKRYDKRLEELVRVLLEKESRAIDYNDDNYVELAPYKRRMFVAFARDWVGRLIARNAEKRDHVGTDIIPADDSNFVDERSAASPATATVTLEARVGGTSPRPDEAAEALEDAAETPSGLATPATISRSTSRHNDCTLNGTPEQSDVVNGTPEESDVEPRRRPSCGGASGRSSAESEIVIAFPLSPSLRSPRPVAKFEAPASVVCRLEEAAAAVSPSPFSFWGEVTAASSPRVNPSILEDRQHVVDLDAESEAKPDDHLSAPRSKRQRVRGPTPPSESRFRTLEPFEETTRMHDVAIQIACDANLGSDLEMIAEPDEEAIPGTDADTTLFDEQPASATADERECGFDTDVDMNPASRLTIADQQAETEPAHASTDYERDANGFALEMVPATEAARLRRDVAAVYSRACLGAATPAIEGTRYPAAPTQFGSSFFTELDNYLRALSPIRETGSDLDVAVYDQARNSDVGPKQVEGVPFEARHETECFTDTTAADSGYDIELGPLGDVEESVVAEPGSTTIAAIEVTRDVHAGVEVEVEDNIGMEPGATVAESAHASTACKCDVNEQWGFQVDSSAHGAVRGAETDTTLSRMYRTGSPSQSGARFVLDPTHNSTEKAEGALRTLSALVHTGPDDTAARYDEEALEILRTFSPLSDLETDDAAMLHSETEEANPERGVDSRTESTLVAGEYRGSGENDLESPRTGREQDTGSQPDSPPTGHATAESADITRPASTACSNRTRRRGRYARSPPPSVDSQGDESAGEGGKFTVSNGDIQNAPEAQNIETVAKSKNLKISRRVLAIVKPFESDPSYRALARYVEGLDRSDIAIFTASTVGLPQTVSFTKTTHGKRRQARFILAHDGEVASGIVSVSPADRGGLLGKAVMQWDGHSFSFSEVGPSGSAGELLYISVGRGRSVRTPWKWTKDEFLKKLSPYKGVNPQHYASLKEEIRLLSEKVFI